jgi:hypothetical protein
MEKKFCGLNPQKSEKAHTFVWEPIEDLNLKPRFLTWALLSFKKLKSTRKIKKIDFFLQ